MNPAVQNSLQLRDIHLPAAQGFWPPAPGWWILAAVTVAALIWLGMITGRQLRIRRQRKRIMSLLDQMEQSTGTDTPEYLARLSQLLKQLALMHYPGQDVASLSGGDWLKFLDGSGGDGRFIHGPGHVLADGPYMNKLSEAIDSAALTALVRDWIRKNTGVTHGA